MLSLKYCHRRREASRRERRARRIDTWPHHDHDQQTSRKEENECERRGRRHERDCATVQCHSGKFRRYQLKLYIIYHNKKIMRTSHESLQASQNRSVRARMISGGQCMSSDGAMSRRSRPWKPIEFLVLGWNRSLTGRGCKILRLNRRDST